MNSNKSSKQVFYHLFKTRSKIVMWLITIFALFIPTYGWSSAGQIATALLPNAEAMHRGHEMAVQQREEREKRRQEREARGIEEKRCFHSKCYNDTCEDASPFSQCVWGTIYVPFSCILGYNPFTGDCMTCSVGCAKWGFCEDEKLLHDCEEMNLSDSLLRCSLLDSLVATVIGPFCAVGKCLRSISCVKNAETNNIESASVQKTESAQDTDDVRVLRNDTVLRPVVSAIVIPEIARGHEDVYRRFYNGRLIYKKGTAQEVVLPISRLANPLNGIFDLSRCGGRGRYLQIATGYKKNENPVNADKVEIWFAPRFLIEKELDPAIQQFSGIMDSWQEAKAPVGIFWTCGKYPIAGNNFNYLTTKDMDSLETKNLYNSRPSNQWRGGPTMSGFGGDLARAQSDFTFCL